MDRVRFPAPRLKNMPRETHGSRPSIRTSPGNEGFRTEDLLAKEVTIASSSGPISFKRLKDGSIDVQSGSGGLRFDNFRQLEKAVQKLRPKKFRPK